MKNNFQKSFLVVLVFLLLTVSCFAISDVPPENPKFIGSGYVTVPISGQPRTIYFPSSYMRGYLGLDEDGALFNVSSSSFTGYFYIGNTEYTVNFRPWNYPRYYPTNHGAGTISYTDIIAQPISSNADIPDAMRPAVSVSDYLPWVSVILLGGLFVCYLTKSKR